MKKNNIKLVVVIAIIAIAFLGGFYFHKATSVGEADVIRDAITELVQAEATITQVVRIVENGNTSLEKDSFSISTPDERTTNSGNSTLQILSLTTTGWEDFLKRYPGDGYVCISNLEIDRLFTFEEVDPEYPAEVMEFLEKDKEPMMIFSSGRFPENNGIFFGEGFYVSYNQSQSWQWSETIEIALETEDGFVKFEINGAINGKKLYCSKPYAKNGIEFLIFNKDGNLFAINEKMKMFQLVPR